MSTRAAIVTTGSPRRRSVRRTRGAVMIEAALVLPLLCAFLGLFVFFHRGYKEKIRLRAEAREQAFAAASSGCASGSSGTETSMETGARQSAVGSTAAQKKDGTSSVLSFDHGTATAKKQSTVSWNTAWGPWSKKLRAAESIVYCNERGVSTSATSWLEWGTKK